MIIKSDTFLSSVPATADLLRHLFPVQALLHVGAGEGKSAVRCWQEWDLAHAILIEANPEYQETLQDAVTQKPGWHAISALIGDQEIETIFYQASCPSESGVVPPHQWKKIWPNLAEITSSHLHQTRLDTLLANPSYETVSREINWAVIDCMPALPILQGAGKYIEQWDVIRLRAILDETTISMSTAGLSAISDYLGKNGFRQITVTESNHPAMGEAIFVKDWKDVLQDSRVHQARQSGEYQAQLEQLSNTGDEQAKLAQDLQAQIEQLTKARDEQKNLAEDRHQQLETVTTEKVKQSKLAHERRSQITQLSKARDEQAKLAQDFQTQIEQLIKARDEQKKLVEDLQQQIEKNNNKQNALLTEKERRIKELETKLDETYHRQRLLDDEMLKAEAQIDLIKDILLREDNL